MLFHGQVGRVISNQVIQMMCVPAMFPISLGKVFLTECQTLSSVIVSLIFLWLAQADQHAHL